VSTAFPGPVSARVEGDQVDAVTFTPLELRSDLILRASQLIETVDNKFSGEPVAHLLDGMGEPGSLVPVVVG
jgi:hypothetical protein